MEQEVLGDERTQIEVCYQQQDVFYSKELKSWLQIPLSKAVYRVVL